MPVVTLKMGSNLNPEDIKDGDDVYFECNIRANPKAYKLSWYHNVSTPYYLRYARGFNETPLLAPYVIGTSLLGYSSYFRSVG